jgi:hypothetical protein
VRIRGSRLVRRFGIIYHTGYFIAVTIHVTMMSLT